MSIRWIKAGPTKGKQNTKNKPKFFKESILNEDIFCYSSRGFKGRLEIPPIFFNGK
jgi:hypothetical protein